jgi:hypothetical protein
VYTAVRVASGRTTVQVREPGIHPHARMDGMTTIDGEVEVEVGFEPV